MFGFVVLILVAVACYWLFTKGRLYKVKWSTFRKKSPKPISDEWFNGVICGPQGTGKTYLAVYLATLQNKKRCKYIKTNIKSLKLQDYDVRYFEKIEEIFRDTESNCIYIIDEVSRKYDKSSRTDTQFYAWLMQSRKRCRLVYLITQEFKELPMWIRRPLKRSYSTKPFLFFKNIFITTIGDAENMILDKDTLEWTCPPISFLIYKRNKCITDLYDTFEPINQL